MRWRMACAPSCGSLIVTTTSCLSSPHWRRWPSSPSSAATGCSTAAPTSWRALSASVSSGRASTPARWKCAWSARTTGCRWASRRRRGSGSRAAAPGRSSGWRRRTRPTMPGNPADGGYAAREGHAQLESHHALRATGNLRRGPGEGHDGRPVRPLPVHEAVTVTGISCSSCPGPRSCRTSGRRRRSCPARGRPAPHALRDAKRVRHPRVLPRGQLQPHPLALDRAAGAA